LASFDFNHRVAAHGPIALSPGPAGAFDAGGVSGPGMVLKAASGDYRMWYEAVDASTSPSTNRTGYATSSDGDVWTKSGSNPLFVPSGAAENNEASFTCVFFDVNDSAYRAYYHGGNNSGGTFGRAIFYATAPDLTNGGTWTRANSGVPILQKGTSGAWDDSFVADAKVIQVAAADYRMWYHGARISDGKGQIGYATSTDGVTWTKSVANPVIALSAGSWEDNIFCFCPLMISGSEFHGWYNAVDGSGNARMGYATSNDGVSWTKSVANPVMGYSLTASPADSIHVYQENDSWVRFVYGSPDTSAGTVNSKRVGNLRPARVP
jgi:hypothetical protein